MWDREAKVGRPKSAPQLRTGLTTRRDACRSTPLTPHPAAPFPGHDAGSPLPLLASSAGKTSERDGAQAEERLTPNHDAAFPQHRPPLPPATASSAKTFPTHDAGRHSAASSSATESERARPNAGRLTPDSDETSPPHRLPLPPAATSSRKVPERVGAKAERPAHDPEDAVPIGLNRGTDRAAARWKEDVVEVATSKRRIDIASSSSSSSSKDSSRGPSPAQRAARVDEDLDGGGNGPNSNGSNNSNGANASAALRGGRGGSSESFSSPFDGIQVTCTELWGICKTKGVACPTMQKEALIDSLTPLFETPEDVARALQEVSGAVRPRSIAGRWRGSRADYEKMKLKDLQEEALCEGVALTIYDRMGLRRRDKSASQLRVSLLKRRGECLGYDLTDFVELPLESPSGRFNLAAVWASSATGVAGWDMSTLEQLFLEPLKDLCRDSGLMVVGSRHEVVERILDARTFAASLRVKHPSSFERGASGQGSWWGFPGHYGVLDPADLEAEAVFSAVVVTSYRIAGECKTKSPEALAKALRNRRANFAPDLDDVVEIPMNRFDLAALWSSSANGGGEGAGGAALTLEEEMMSTVIWDRSTLEQLSGEALKDLARDSGMTVVGKKVDLVERILDARSFAISLRAKHPSSFERGASEQGSWWGFPGHYGVLQSADLEKEADFSGVHLNFHNPGANEFQRKSSETLVKSLRKRRANFAPALDDDDVVELPLDLLNLTALWSSSATGGGEGAGGAAPTLEEEMAAAVVWDRSTLEQLSGIHLKDLCRDAGLSLSGGSRHALVERILDARTFAISLRAKHPRSFERGAGEQGSWWGFPGHYGVLDPADLVKEAIFSSVVIKLYNSGVGHVQNLSPQAIANGLRKRRANFAPDLHGTLSPGLGPDDLPAPPANRLNSPPPSASGRPSKRPRHAVPTGAGVIRERTGVGAQETCGWTGRLGALAEHLAECNFAVAACTHAGCTAQVQRRDVGAHEAGCVWRGGGCARCGFEFTLGEPREHVCERQTLARQTVPLLTTVAGTVKVVGESVGHFQREVLELRALLARKCPTFPSVPAPALSTASPRAFPRLCCTLPVPDRAPWGKIMPERPGSAKTHLADVRAAIGAEQPGEAEGDEVVRGEIREMYAGRFRL
ncbi:hypothetical protein T484DRAFT_2288171 [Baffinella frigidus]|nr:hypothetical protein T484DRAFT_2288171 [Cryptophyta sp. CCMP2293]